MKLLLTALLVLFAGVSLALFAKADPGYILLNYGSTKIESTLALALVVIALCFMVLYYLIRLLAGMWAVPRRMRYWQQRRQRHRARVTLTRGLLQLEEGKWAEAEKNLSRHAAHGEPRLLHYLAAARAAQKQGAHERRDQYLQLAHESTPGADIAVGLTQAELQLSHQQTAQAMATLQHLATLAPKHGYVQKLLLKLYLEQHDWRQLLALLPGLRKRKLIDEDEADQLEVRAYLHQFEQLERTQGLMDVQAIWQQLPKRLHWREEILLSYVQQLHVRGGDTQTEALLRESLRKQWSEALIRVYGLLEGPDPAKQLTHAESWLKLHGNDPVLLLTLGRLCLRNRLWGKGRAYFESSVGITPSLECYQELATLLEQMNEPEAAMSYYRQGMRLVAGPAPAPSYQIEAAETPAPRMEKLAAGQV